MAKMFPGFSEEIGDRVPDFNEDDTETEPGTEPGDELAGYRADARLEGAVTFGMNAIVLGGIDRTLRAGMSGEATIAF